MGARRRCERFACDGAIFIVSAGENIDKTWNKSWQGPLSEIESIMQCQTSDSTKVPNQADSTKVVKKIQRLF